MNILCLFYDVTIKNSCCHYFQSQSMWCFADSTNQLEDRKSKSFLQEQDVVNDPIDVNLQRKRSSRTRNPRTRSPRTRSLRTRSPRTRSLRTRSRRQLNDYHCYFVLMLCFILIFVNYVIFEIISNTISRMSTNY